MTFVIDFGAGEMAACSGRWGCYCLHSVKAGNFRSIKYTCILPGTAWFKAFLSDLSLGLLIGFLIRESIQIQFLYIYYFFRTKVGEGRRVERARRLCTKNWLITFCSRLFTFFSLQQILCFHFHSYQKWRFFKMSEMSTQGNF